MKSTITLRIRADLIAWLEARAAARKAETGRAHTLQATLAPQVERMIERMQKREARSASNAADLGDAAGGQTVQPSMPQQ